MGRTVQQAAALPYRETAFGVEVLLVSRASGGWGVPKGGIKRGHDACQTARLEALEEAGVLGELIRPDLGRYRFRKRGAAHEVAVFALRVERVLGRWQEDRRRVRVWVPAPEAPALLRPELGRLVTSLRHRLLTSAAHPRALAA